MKQKKLTSVIPYPKKVLIKDGNVCNMNGARVYLTQDQGMSFDYLLSYAGISSPEIFNGETSRLIIGEPQADEIYPASENKEAYRINAERDGILITANSDIGLSHAAKMLAKIFTAEKEIPCLEIEDEPDISFRAIHMCAFDPQDGSEKDDTSPEAVKKRIELAAFLGYNYVFLEFWGVFPYEKHPYAVWEHTPYTKDVIEDIVSFCIKDLHITPCPAQNLTSHAGWSRITTRRHVVLDRRPDLSEMWIPGGWCFATENPKTKEFLRDIIDELAAAFHNPPMFHICCDKAFGFGSGVEDRTKSADILFASHIANLNTYLQGKGIRSIMWADMLYTSLDSLTFKCAPFVSDTLSKNIIMNIWTHNDPGEYWNDVDFFENKGYETVYSPFVNYKSIENMIKMCIGKGSLGIVQTTWHKPEFAKPYFTYSAAKQWNFNAIIGENDINDFLNRFKGGAYENCSLWRK